MTISVAVDELGMEYSECTAERHGLDTVGRDVCGLDDVGTSIPGGAGAVKKLKSIHVLR